MLVGTMVLKESSCCLSPQQVTAEQSYYHQWRFSHHLYVGVPTQSLVAMPVSVTLVSVAPASAWVLSCFPKEKRPMTPTLSAQS
jgi:hypothetical protein